MKALSVILAVVLTQEARIPKYSPNGVWETETGSQYELRLTGSDLHVKIVPGSNPKYLQYEVDMKNQDEVNTYKGKGFFVAKMEGGKECKFETEWLLVVVSSDRIIGGGTNIIADKETCEIKEKAQVQLNLKKKQ